MDQATYDRFAELRQSYYISGRALLINQLFGMAGINLGYCIELSLKFVLASNNFNERDLYRHNLKKLYDLVTSKGYLLELKASPDFIRFADERLNARYPIMIADNARKHEADSRVNLFTIDMLHCYDDFILQLDDAITEVANDPRISVGFRSCRELQDVKGRIFFHCNDHAFSRIAKYRDMLSNNRSNGDSFEINDLILSEAAQLWNFTGLMAYRPWGPKQNWAPATDFSFPKIVNGRTDAKAAKWQANTIGAEMHMSSMELILPAGTYRTRISEMTLPKTD